MSTATKWKCEVCGETFDTKGMADACEQKPAKALSVVVGDIVHVGQHFGWFDGKPEWVENRARIEAKGGKKTPCPHGDRNCFGDCCNYRFYYVVTAIDHTKGRWRYHLWTLAMSGKQGYEQGYTFDESHLTPMRAKKVPAQVQNAAAKLIGRKTTRLI